jgi:uncharacterized repeat protein (TIGR02543 family)
MKKTLAALGIALSLTVGLLVAAAPQAQAIGSCYVGYFPNGNYGKMQKDPFPCDTKVKLWDASTFKRSYHTISYWETSATYGVKGGVRYKPGATVKLAVTNHLYAQWTRIKYTLTYSYNGKKSSVSAGAGLPYKITKANPSKTHYKFTGWKYSGNGKIYKKGQSTPTITKKATLTAQWARTHYKLTYELQTNEAKRNGGVAEKWVKKGDPLTIDGNAPTRDHYEFLGWNSKKDGTGTWYQPGAQFTTSLTKDQTVYAIWKQVEFKIAYSKNKGKGTIPATVWLKTGDTFTVPATSDLKRSGYSFDGWNSQADGRGSDYVAGTAYPVGTANITIYAKWWAEKQTPKPTIGTKLDAPIRVGEVLTVDTGDWFLKGQRVDEFSYQWLANGSKITGAVGTELLLSADGSSTKAKKSTANHYDKKISVKITGILRNSKGEVIAKASKTSSQTKKVPKGEFNNPSKELTGTVTSDGKTTTATAVGSVSTYCKGACKPKLSITWQQCTLTKSCSKKWKTLKHTAVSPTTISDGSYGKNITSKTTASYKLGASSTVTLVRFLYQATASGYGYKTVTYNDVLRCDIKAGTCTVE